MARRRIPRGDKKAERRRDVVELIEKLRAGIAEGALDPRDIDRLEAELRGMRRRIRRKLARPRGLGSSSQAEALEASLFTDDAATAVLASWEVLQRCNVDRLAVRALGTHYLISLARQAQADNESPPA